ncbi:hypothetical protein Csa_015052 [Cucumis sativus]|nr:hypothetical protein Csa_015052 [Cucumis sativus]
MDVGGVCVMPAFIEGSLSVALLKILIRKPMANAPSLLNYLAQLKVAQSCSKIVRKNAYILEQTFLRSPVDVPSKFLTVSVVISPVDSLCFPRLEKVAFSTPMTLRMPGEEPPESLFMKELKKRGITPTSLLEDTNSSDFELGGEMTGENRDFSRRSAVSTEVNKSLSNQRERSMQLNSEGLEGLIPRAKLLLTIGGTFFLGFWPLIIITVSFFFGLYFFLGASFIHDGQTPISPPPYVDPYALLEDERISQIAPPVN